MPNIIISTPVWDIAFFAPMWIIHGSITTTDYLIANAPSPPVYFEPAVIVYYRRFQMDPAVMLTYHRRFVIRPGGDMLASPPSPFGTGSDRLSPPVRNKPAVMGRWR